MTTGMFTLVVTINDPLGSAAGVAKYTSMSMSSPPNATSISASSSTVKAKVDAPPGTTNELTGAPPPETVIASSASWSSTVQPSQLSSVIVSVSPGRITWLSPTPSPTAQSTVIEVRVSLGPPRATAAETLPATTRLPAMAPMRREFRTRSIESPEVRGSGQRSGVPAGRACLGGVASVRADAHHPAGLVRRRTEAYRATKWL